MNSLDAYARSQYLGIQVNRYCSVVAFATLYYDYILTFPLERERFWKHSKITWVSALFLLNRYIIIFGSIPVIFEYFGDFSEQSCHTLQTYHQYLELGTQIVIALILALRTYTVYERRKWVLWLLIVSCCSGLLSGITCVILSGAHGSKLSPPSLPFPLHACDLSLSSKQGYYLAGAWSSVLIFDTLICILTLVRAMKLEEMWSSNLLKVALRDGIVYFVALAGFVLSNILMFILADPALKGLTTTMTNVLSSILVVRLMLNLRDPSLHPPQRPSTWTSSESTDLTDELQMAEFSNHAESPFSRKTDRLQAQRHRPESENITETVLHIA